MLASGWELPYVPTVLPTIESMGHPQPGCSNKKFEVCFVARCPHAGQRMRSCFAVELFWQAGLVRFRLQDFDTSRFYLYQKCPFKTFFDLENCFETSKTAHTQRSPFWPGIEPATSRTTIASQARFAIGGKRTPPKFQTRLTRPFLLRALALPSTHACKWVGTPLCPYGIAYRRVYGSSTTGLFKQ